MIGNEQEMRSLLRELAGQAAGRTDAPDPLCGLLRWQQIYRDGHPSPYGDLAYPLALGVLWLLESGGEDPRDGTVAGDAHKD